MSCSWGRHAEFKIHTSEETERGNLLDTRNPILPNFFIVGAPKCGTTSLYFHLKQHPQVYLPAVKEPHFFSDCSDPSKISTEHCNGDRSAYLRLYEEASGYLAIGDASPSYLSDRNAPSRIKQESPEAKIIIILRDPVERAYSQYMMNRFAGLDTMPFLDAIQYHDKHEQPGWWLPRSYVELGMYSEQVERYFDLFGRENVLVLLSEDLTKNPEKLFADLANHIGVAPDFFAGSRLSEAQNTYRMPRFMFAYRLLTSNRVTEIRRKVMPEALKRWLRQSHFLYQTRKPAMDKRAKEHLMSIFGPDLDRLETLLGRRLPSLRKSWQPRNATQGQ